VNEGCGRKIRTKDYDLWTNLAEKVRIEQPPPAERKVLEAILRKHPVEYSCCTIIHGDAKKHLPNFAERTFDLIVTDPPYGKRLKGWQEHHAPSDWDQAYPTVAVRQMIPLARLGSYFFCEWDNLVRNAIHLPKPKSMLVWTKKGGGAGDCFHEHARDYEMAYFYLGDPKQHEFKKRPNSVLSFKAPGNDYHPTQKPVGLIREIFGWYDFETVFDPFMGSGTTAVAAKESRKHFLGFEANKTFFNRAVQRIAEVEL
jgi:site-specific DNA-methyltransferase (adenine-specific)